MTMLKWSSLGLASILLFGPPAWAEDKPSRTVDMTQVLMDENGLPAADFTAKEPVPPGEKDPDPRCLKCPKLTLGRAVSQALFAAFPEDKDAAEQKWARASLAARIKNDSNAVLTAEEAAVIKRQIGKAFGGIVLMQAYPLLDPNAKPPEVK